MKKLSIIFSLLTVFLTSCEKVVNVNLNNAAPQYVVEGEVFEGVDTVEVHVAKTTDYYGFAPQVQLNDAQVVLSDNEGNAVTIPSVGNGHYALSGFSGVPGRTYQLKVTVDGKEFTASAQMPLSVLIDSVTQEYKEKDFRKEGYEVAARLTDPASGPNYYRLVYIINDTLQNKSGDLYLFNDKFNNGKQIKADLFRRFDPGDKIQFELRAMDAAVYDFFTSLDDVLNNQNGPAPANPNTNIKGGALGYFGAFTSSTGQILVTQ